MFKEDNRSSFIKKISKLKPYKFSVFLDNLKILIEKYQPIGVTKVKMLVSKSLLR